MWRIWRVSPTPFDWQDLLTLEARMRLGQTRAQWLAMPRTERMETLAYLRAKQQGRMRLLDEVREKAASDSVLAQVLILLAE